MIWTDARFYRRRHCPARAAIGQSQRISIKRYSEYPRMFVKSFVSIDRSQLEQDAADCWRKVPSEQRELTIHGTVDHLQTAQ
ncbi:MAG: hypothetical protein GY820_31950 [Gammaproteobacteria bacterium]|nr:hypothetical protein [Gammaproteobacteria bacterium]